MNTLIELSRKDIEKRYMEKPILIVTNGDKKKWYIADNVYSQMPLHMLTAEESDMYNKNKESISGISLTGDDDTGYVMWINFNKDNGWKAYGYE